MVSWRLALSLAAGIGVLSSLAGRNLAGRNLARRRRVEGLTVAAAAAYGRETALILALYAAWQVGLALLVTRVSGAFSNAARIWRLERLLHLPSEVSFQRWAPPYPWLLKTCNQYYAWVHSAGLIIFLIWLFARPRAFYLWGRNILVLATGA